MLKKIGYLSGPVDARRIYDSRMSGVHTDLFGTSYLSHLMEVCEDQDRQAVIITTHGSEAYDAQCGRFTILNRPQPGGRSLQYHLRQVSWARQMLGEFERRGVGTAVLTAGQHYWLVTPPFRRRGMRFINSYHCAIRALGHKRLSPHELFIRLTSLRHLAHGDPTMVIVPTIGDELAKEPGAQKRKVLQLLPDYNREVFANFTPPPLATEPQSKVNVIFAGRVTRNKGVFDILAVAEELAQREGPEVHFHIHGEGDALGALTAAVAASPARHLVQVYGFTAGLQLTDHYGRADIVIVPTRSDFDEGVAKSVVEGVLTLRPVVTSIACPSIHMLADACVEAQVDSPSSYADAVWKLANNPDLVRAKSRSGATLRDMFFDPPERYDRRLREALTIVEGAALPHQNANRTRMRC